MVSEVLSLAGEKLPQFDEAVSRSFGHSPLRRPGSVRRTSSILATWPDGIGGLVDLRGTARDYLTPFSGEGRAIAIDHIHATAENRTIRSVDCEPARVQIGELVGATAGSHLRTTIAQSLPEDLQKGTPLYLLLDDLAGTTLVAKWAFSRWPSEGVRLGTRSMEGICIGFRPGSGALKLDGTAREGQNVTPVVLLPHPDDPEGWHELRESGGVNFRRARRIDVWRESDGVLRIDSVFQDSGNSPSGQRIAIHEYHVTATADRDGRLVSIEATPGTLPFPECRAAPTNIDDLLGLPLSSLRQEVLSRLYKTFGCTHLNDMLRALAEVPTLAASLPEAD